MKIPGLVNVLNGLTNIPFTEWAWSEAPKGAYGVVSIDRQIELNADEDPVAEKMKTGYVDVFIEAKDPDPTDDVENALKTVGVWFTLESVQFEPETGLLHFEWRWRDVINTAMTEYVVATFHGHDGEVAEPQIILSGQTVTAPANPPSYTENGLTILFRQWTPALYTPITKNTVFEAEYCTEAQVKKVSGTYYAYKSLSPDVPFTADEISSLIDYFNSGLMVYAHTTYVRYSASDVNTEGVYWWGNQNVARWAT